MRKGWFWIPAVAMLAVVQPTDAAAQPPQLAGVWVLDEAASDTLVLEPSDTAQSRSSGLRLGLGGWIGGYPPRSRSIRDPQRMHDAVAAVSPAPATLYIAQDDSTVTISYDSAPPVTLHPDGRKVNGSWRSHFDVRTRARWHDHALVVERTLPTQVEIRETWTRDGTTLTLRATADGPLPRRLELTLVYHLKHPDTEG